MIIMSHRGYWLEPQEKNSRIAFARSFDLGFGTETDVRDYNGKLVISHDIPTGSEFSLEEFLVIFNKRKLPLAINIKADGLAASLKLVMEQGEVADWFVFDMSVPDTRVYLELGMPVFTRMSEVEQTPIWLKQVAGIWLDAFYDTWYDVQQIEVLLAQGKRVCVVSSELHKRDHRSLWELLHPLSTHAQLMLCTDLPEHAREFFGENR